MEQEQQKKNLSELRLDLASKDWVVIATGRAKKPEMFKKTKEDQPDVGKDKCPFCNTDPNVKASVAYLNGKKIDLEKEGPMPKEWTTISIPNKFPAFVPAEELFEEMEGGLYQRLGAVGYHDLVITSDHDKSLALLSQESIKELIDVYQERSLQLKKMPYVGYVSIFHNHGPDAGASQPHPHSQIIGQPLVDVDLKNQLLVASKYFQDSKKCISCEMTKWELQVKERVIFENEHFAAICPFASKSAFQVVITPKKHGPYFEDISEEQKQGLAEAFKVVLGKLYKGLNNPDYNFYLHNAPCGLDDYGFYHWHWTIMPKTSVWAGFEIGSRMEISTIEPEQAAEYLRQQ